MDRPQTVGELKSSGYTSRGVKDEMRQNLIRKLKAGVPLFPGIVGYDDTVLPQVQNAILSRHDMLFLGLRGQAKTRMLRQLVEFLDDVVPIVQGSEINDDPLAPISRLARDVIASQGDATPIEWIGRERRYQEKLATPDVTIADLIGEIDLIKHAEGRYLSNELTMHFGLIPRANRGIFCMNELPDLSPKIQVGLFNVLEERDVQVRGFPVRLDLDLCLVFYANPEDYTNRGRIVTPLKDRIGSVIRTHYPMTRKLGMEITDANAWSERDRSSGGVRVLVPRFIKEVLEELARLARSSPAVNQQSGVSVRMSIANMENAISNAERRGIAVGEINVVPRISDLFHVAASTRGKIELTLSDEEGQEDRVIEKLLGEAVKNIFELYCDAKQFRSVVEAFEVGRTFLAGERIPSGDYVQRLQEMPSLKKEVTRFMGTVCDGELAPDASDALTASVVEFLLEGLHVANRLNRNVKPEGVVFKK